MEKMDQSSLTWSNLIDLENQRTLVAPNDHFFHPEASVRIDLYHLLDFQEISVLQTCLKQSCNLCLLCLDKHSNGWSFHDLSLC